MHSLITFAVTHTLRWIASRGVGETTHFSRFNTFAKRKKRKQKKEVGSEAQIGTCRCSTSTLEDSCGCTALDMPQGKEMAEQIDWQGK